MATLTKFSGWKSRNDFELALAKRKFKMLAGGMYSSVWAKDGANKVIKVNRATDAWREYVYHAHRFGFGGTLAPRIYSLKMHRWQGEDYCVAVMERLDSTTGRLEEDHFDRIRDEYNQLYKTFRGPSEEHEGEYAKFALFVHEFKHAISANNDLHDGNFMVKGDRVVATDPFSSKDHIRDPNWQVPNRVRAKDLENLLVPLPMAALWQHSVEKQAHV